MQSSVNGSNNSPKDKTKPKDSKSIIRGKHFKVNDSRLTILGKRIVRRIKKFTMTPLQKDVWTSTLLAIILVVGFISVYSFGYKEGYKYGDINNSSDPFSNFFNNSTSGIAPISGLIVDISNDKITIDSAKGERQELKITEKTKVTKKGETYSLSDVKKNQRVTVYTGGSNNSTEAIRIVISTK